MTDKGFSKVGSKNNQFMKKNFFMIFLSQKIKFPIQLSVFKIQAYVAYCTLQSTVNNVKNRFKIFII